MRSPQTKINNIDVAGNIIKSLPEINFVRSEDCKWDPKTKQVHYKEIKSQSSLWSFLHEVGHALLNHTQYKSDLELLKMEVMAWEKAKDIASQYNLKISQEHIEKCVDSYRDWLHKRSKCRRCEQAGIEGRTGIYVCFNCKFTWKVTAGRFCRVYKRQIPG